ncbi:MAG: glycosyltransferase [Bacteroidia bacterium]|nr:glycosyltransferase [Bacteroidia bacterium]
MSQETFQVFQSKSPRRWKNFLLAIRLLLLLIILGAITLIIAVFHESATRIPDLVVRKTVKNIHKETDLERYKKEDRKEILGKIKPQNFKGKKSSHKNATSGIRAGFYVVWDPISYVHLKENILALNMIVPEWLFLNDKADTVITAYDKNFQKVLDIAKANKIKIMAMVSNYNTSKKKFDPDNVSRIVSTKERRARLINSILNFIKKHKLQGVNIDFEQLHPKDNVNILMFHYELYYALHKNGYLVTKDVAPQRENIDISQFCKNNDYLIIMAYDQNTMSSDPGPIADAKWIEDILDNWCEKVDPKKLVLSIAAYGYDWKGSGNGSITTYQRAVTVAKQYDAAIDFDADTYNSYFNYYDENGDYHDVYFADAAMNFNNIRIAEDYGLAGVSVWRIGSEDERMWEFFKDNLSFPELKSDTLYDLKQFSKTPPSDTILYFGKGDILDIETPPLRGEIGIDFDNKNMVIAEEEYKSLPTTCVIRRFGNKDSTLAITFDDGPDERYTPRILDILKKTGVKATFFVIGLNAENNISLLKRTYDEGHEIGNHTFSHPNVYEISPERFDFEINLSRRLIECVTGHTTILYRSPFNSDTVTTHYYNIRPTQWAQESNYYSVGVSIDPYDWKPGTTADSIMNRIRKKIKSGSILLLHDSGAEREATIEALPRIIRYFKLRGYKFTTISGLVDKDRDFAMPNLSSKGDVYLSKANWYIATAFNWLEKFVYALFIVATLLSVARMLFIAMIAFINKLKSAGIIRRLKSISEYAPRVSVIVPAYNEEVYIVKNINNLLTSDYPDFEVIVVDDGSKDNTFEKISSAFGNHPKVLVLTKPNGGKATALNYGIEHMSGEIMVCIDADTQLHTDAIKNLIPYFHNSKIGAVSGNVKIGNENNLLTIWQSIEYITSQNFDRRAFDLMNCISVVPGAIGAFRKSIVEEVGMYTTDTLAEDCDITIRIIKKGYKVVYSPHAIAYTEAPASVKMFLRQRFRWNFGILQSVWKHRYVFFNPRYKALGMVAFPNILLFQLMLPVFAPIADLMLIVGLLTENFNQILIYYLLFIVVDFLAGMLAFSFEKENMARLLGIIPQQFVYRQLMYYIAIKSLLKAVKGELMTWGIQKRMGNIKVQNNKVVTVN